MAHLLDGQARAFGCFSCGEFFAHWWIGDVGEFGRIIRNRVTARRGSCGRRGRLCSGRGGRSWWCFPASGRVRMSSPASSGWGAKLRRRVCKLTRLATPARRAARVRARWMRWGCRWWRFGRPEAERGSALHLGAGDVHCQAQSRAVPGSFLASASGRSTSSFAPRGEARERKSLQARQGCLGGVSVDPGVRVLQLRTATR